MKKFVNIENFIKAGSRSVHYDINQTFFDTDICIFRNIQKEPSTKLCIDSMVVVIDKCSDDFVRYLPNIHYLYGTYIMVKSHPSNIYTMSRLVNKHCTVMVEDKYIAYTNSWHIKHIIEIPQNINNLLNKI